jgi:hypothetical protein
MGRPSADERSGSKVSGQETTVGAPMIGTVERGVARLWRTLFK